MEGSLVRGIASGINSNHVTDGAGFARVPQCLRQTLVIGYSTSRATFKNTSQVFPRSTAAEVRVVVIGILRNASKCTKHVAVHRESSLRVRKQVRNVVTPLYINQKH